MMTEDELLAEDLKSELVEMRPTAVKEELKRLRRTVYETHGMIAIVTEVMFYAKGQNHPLIGDIAQNLIEAMDKEPAEFWDAKKNKTIADLLGDFTHRVKKRKRKCCTTTGTTLSTQTSTLNQGDSDGHLQR